VIKRLVISGRHLSALRYIEAIGTLGNLLVMCIKSSMLHGEVRLLIDFGDLYSYSSVTTPPIIYLSFFFKRPGDIVKYRSFCLSQ